MTSRHRGGGHKQLYRIIDFRRDLLDVRAKVQAIEYDPNRTAHIALLAYTNGEKRYILAPEGLQVGASIVASNKATTNDFTVGNNFPLKLIPPSTLLHCVELLPGRGAQIARGAGTSAELIAVENGQAQLKMPSGELRLRPRELPRDHRRSSATATTASSRSARPVAPAGSAVRPHVRGVAMNPVDHPNGGGQGKSKGGGGRQQLVSPWGQLAKGFPTRRRSKLSNSMIIVHHNGRKPRGQK